MIVEQESRQKGGFHPGPFLMGWWVAMMALLWWVFLVFMAWYIPSMLLLLFKRIWNPCTKPWKDGLCLGCSLDLETWAMLMESWIGYVWDLWPPLGLVHDSWLGNKKILKILEVGGLRVLTSYNKLFPSERIKQPGTILQGSDLFERPEPISPKPLRVTNQPHTRSPKSKKKKWDIFHQ